MNSLRLHIPAHLCRDYRAAVEREWHVTNGLGGYAAGTLAGTLTRKYHGLLIAALQPPLGRTLLAAKLDETAWIGGRAFPFYCNAWRDGTTETFACSQLRGFDLVLGIPTWTFEFGRRRIRRRIWMEPQRQATFVEYELEPASKALDLALRLLVNHRDHHGVTAAGALKFDVSRTAESLTVATRGAPVALRVGVNPRKASQATFAPSGVWHRDFFLEIEAERGYPALDNHYHAADISLRLEPGAPLAVLVATACDYDKIDFDEARARREEYARGLLGTFAAARAAATAPDGDSPGAVHTAAAAPAADSPKADAPGAAPGPPHSEPRAIAQLVLAADQFIVARPTLADPEGRTIIAGYPWFSDWGRDTMIALPGLTLTTGRPAIARQILLTWATYVDRGMIPNRFPEEGNALEYHTGDATLWFLWAIDQYLAATGDLETARKLWPAVREIIAWHQRGTRHNLHVTEDGLLYAGEAGVNLTWMDAKVHGRVITPRIGKAVELNALWYHGLRVAARLAERLGVDGAEFMASAERCRAAFERFWNPRCECLYDVLDGPNGADPAVRPNQLFAVSLEFSPLPRAQQEAVLRVCERALLTWFGLRSLSPDHPEYRGHYAGELVARDEAYHQGTVWGWLLGPFVLAHYRLYRDAAKVRDWLLPMLGRLWSFGLGTLPEIFDAAEPHKAKGCHAQAWSVAETLRAWAQTQPPAPPPPACP